jgi:hypothetical protein
MCRSVTSFGLIGRLAVSNSIWRPLRGIKSQFARRCPSGSCVRHLSEPNVGETSLVAYCRPDCRRYLNFPSVCVLTGL